MTTVLLGNPAPMMQVLRLNVDEAGQPFVQQTGERAQHLSQTVTRIDMRDGFDDLAEVELALTTNNDRMLMAIARQLDDDHKRYAHGINEIESVWATHCGSGAPVYAYCPDDPEFEAVVAAHFMCHRGEPTALLVSAGRDALHAQHLSTSQPAGFTFMAMSESAVAPSSASVVLPGEITTAGGGLLRASATMAHSAGTNTTTGSKTFTANGSDVLPKVLAKIGMLNAAVSGGTLGYETLLNATSTLTISGDSAAIVWTDTVG